MTPMLDFVRQHRLTVISFVTGFGLLTFELAAARILAPSIGSSTYVWTGVIGVIIAALSLGFFIGGKVADQRNKTYDVVWLLILASIMATLCLISYEGILRGIVDAELDSRVQAVLAALILFAPTSFFIGMTSPYLAKLNVHSLRSTGQSIANLDMFNALGGIVGTFVTGFILFGYIGSHQTIGFVAILLVAIGWLIRPRLRTGRRLIISAVILLTAMTPAAAISGVVSIDTASAHYKVITGFFNDRPAIGLLTGPGGTQSAVYTNGISNPVFWYAGKMAEITEQQGPKSILILGGGAFTLPEYLSQRLPDATIDVVEIDPQLEDISKQYFGYTSPSNVTPIFTDARTYINDTDKTYDMILVDVYGDASIPFTFITKEFGQNLAKRLNNDGMVIANIIAGETGKCKETFQAVDAGYRAGLPYARYTNESGRTEARANYLVAYKKQPFILTEFKELSTPNMHAYTDNFAPAERLYYDCQSESK